MTSAQEIIQDGAGIAVVAGTVGGVWTWINRKMSRSREREIDERLKLILAERDKATAEGTPVERELRHQIDELKHQLHELSEKVDKLEDENEVLRGQLVEAYQMVAAARR